jgi:hypothetical protein
MSNRFARLHADTWQVPQESILKTEKMGRSRGRGCGVSYRDVESGSLGKQGAIPETGRA